MSRFSFMSVKLRLALLVVLALCAMLVVAGVGLFGLHQATSSATVVVDRHLPAEGLIGELRAGVGNLRRFEKDAFLNTGNPAGIESYLPRWHTALKRSRDTATDLDQYIDDDARALLVAVRAGLDGYARGFEGVAARLMRGEFGDAIVANAAMEPLKADIRQLDDKIVALKKCVNAAVARSIEPNQRSTNT